jgi:hypothetical protein
MPVDPTIYGELTQPFRWIDNIDPAVLEAYPLARAVEAQTPFSTLAGTEVVGDARFELLSRHRRRFLVSVDEPDYIRPSDFAGQCPSAILRSRRWGLSAGRRMLIVKFESDYARNETRLLLWG